ncbi:MAG: hypothetical protein LC620_04915, partial [Halobacteriales archaeon]|nr:hypothetical protein [Halobacteriales archaeon]
MRIVHVSGNHVPSLMEGISRNVHSLVATQRAAGDDARLAVAVNPLEAMNRRATLALGAWRARRLAARALREPGVDLVHYHVSLPSLAAFAPRRRRRAPLVVHAWNALLDAPAPRCKGRT